MEDLEANQAILIAALREIAKGEGPFSLDPLTHAANTIEAMKDTAKRALDSISWPQR